MVNVLKLSALVHVVCTAVSREGIVLSLGIRHAQASRLLDELGHASD